MIVEGKKKQQKKEQMNDERIVKIQRKKEIKKTCLKEMKKKDKENEGG